MKAPQIRYLSGWYGEEQNERLIFRWISREAQIKIDNLSSKGEHWLFFLAGHSFSSEKPNLIIKTQEKIIGEVKIDSSFSSYAFRLSGNEDNLLTFSLNKSHQVPGDPRDLGIMISSLEVKDLSTFSPEEKEIILGEGWYEEEKGDFYPFNWLGRQGSILVSPYFWTKYKYLSFYAFSEFYNLTQKLEIYQDGQEVESLPLLPKWNFYSLNLRDIAVAENEESHDWHELKFSLSKLFPQRYHPHDKRELGARFSLLRGHNDDELHQKTQEFHQNARLNYEEMMAGKTTLSSFPQNLGIDLYARCNIKPPCVYCLWTEMKKT